MWLLTCCIGSPCARLAGYQQATSSAVAKVEEERKECGRSGDAYEGEGGGLRVEWGTFSADTSTFTLLRFQTGNWPKDGPKRRLAAFQSYSAPLYVCWSCTVLQVSLGVL